MKEVIIKALKELCRVVLLAIIPVVITSIEQNQIDLRLVTVVGVVAALKFVDKLLHEWGKVVEEETGEVSSLVTGLTRF